jgi:hypothetical protein
MSRDRDEVRTAFFATQGGDSQDAERMRSLLTDVDATEWRFDARSKPRAAGRLMRALRRHRRSLVVMEGTGLFGGLALIAASVLWGTRYVVSSGDAVAPYLRLRGGRLVGLVGLAYETALYRRSAGVIGWTPYVVGRALTLGAPRGVTAENWAEGTASPGDRERVRDLLGIAPDAVVYGIVGSLRWNPTAAYAYGAELVRARVQARGGPAVALVVGDGDALPRLRAEAGDLLGTAVLLPGRIPREDVPAYLAAMDYAVLPQSVDGVGVFRYTTKLSEYLAAGVPVVATRIPAAYDVIGPRGLTLPGPTPWSPEFVSALARHMEDATPSAAGQGTSPERPAAGFSRDEQRVRVARFLADLREPEHPAPHDHEPKAPTP